MSARRAKLKPSEASAPIESPKARSRPTSVNDIMSQSIVPSAVHSLHAEIERAFTPEDATGADAQRIPVGYTIIGASVFSAVCWGMIFALLHA